MNMEFKKKIILILFQAKILIKNIRIIFRFEAYKQMDKTFEKI